MDENLTTASGPPIRSGQPAKALQVLDRSEELSTKSPVAPYDMATIHAGLGEMGQAFGWLEKAYQERGLSLLRMEPTLDGLHPDPRFAELLRRVKLTH